PSTSRPPSRSRNSERCSSTPTPKPTPRAASVSRNTSPAPPSTTSSSTPDPSPTSSSKTATSRSSPPSPPPTPSSPPQSNSAPAPPAYRATRLRPALLATEAEYAFILIACPPSLGLITLNVLTAAQGVLIPIQCEYYALEGISQLLNTVRLVQQNFNPDLAIDGVLLTMYDSRLNLCRQVAQEAKEYFGAKVFKTGIRGTVRLAGPRSLGKPILMYAGQSVGAKSYIAVAQELMRGAKRGDSLPTRGAHE